MVKAAEDAHIERADTINRLTRSLEDSQKQCQQMLEAGMLCAMFLSLWDIKEKSCRALSCYNSKNGVLKNCYFFRCN